MAPKKSLELLLTKAQVIFFFDENGNLKIDSLQKLIGNLSIDFAIVYRHQGCQIRNVLLWVRVSLGSSNLW